MKRITEIRDSIIIKINTELYIPEYEIEDIKDALEEIKDEIDIMIEGLNHAKEQKEMDISSQGRDT